MSGSLWNNYFLFVFSILYNRVDDAETTEKSFIEIVKTNDVNTELTTK